MQGNEVILVDENDQPCGTAEKMEAHRDGRLHRAFSVFIFNHKGEMLLQQRAAAKYHSGSLWTNACCSHPSPGDATIDSARRRLKEEMGFDTPLEEIFSFVYKAEFDNGLTEHEFDHVLAGVYDGLVEFNAEEVMDYCYKPLSEISESLENQPYKYTEWFRLAFPRVVKWFNNKMAISR